MNLPQAIRRAVILRSAVWSTMQGLLPPSSRVQGMSRDPADCAMRRPTCVLPVKKM